MKPTRFRALLLAAVAFLPSSGRAAPGDLDLGFVPEANEQGFSGRIRIRGDETYLLRSSSGPVRILADGQLDASWQLASPAMSPFYDFGFLPAGGWFLATLDSLFVEQPDHTYIRLPGVPSFPQCHPLDDGSLLVVANSPIRLLPDGVPDRGYKSNTGLVSTKFSNGVGGPFIRSALDSQGRLIIGGNFREAIQTERLGLVRLQPDGTLDPDWNPGPALGITLREDNYLTGVPDQVFVASHDSVLVYHSLEDENGLVGHRFAIITADGTVTSSIPARANASITPLIQPDGKIIVYGSFSDWLGTPAKGIVRLNTDGSVDPDFQVGLAGDSGTTVTGAALDDSGRLIISGKFTSVNGVPRPGLARVFAYDPVATAPASRITVQQPRIGTNEVLRLTAQVAGTPLPELQWYRNGEPIPGATHRGLALPVTDGESLGSFQLVASNALGTTMLEFPPVALARRSPRPGSVEPGFNVVLTGFGEVREMVAQEDGRILVGGGSLPMDLPANVPLVGRLLPDGSWDESFGSNGIVSGRGIVANLRVLPDGHILVAGHLLRVAGAEVSGLAELDRAGSLVPRAFPVLDVPNIKAALKLPDGRIVVAGLFNQVDGQAKAALARLGAELTLDNSFTAPLLSASDLASDAQGRLLVAGSSGVWRLLQDGSPDPAFSVATSPAHRLVVEPGGTILVGMPPRRLDDRGQSATEFEPVNGVTAGIVSFISPTLRLRTVLMRDGGVGYLYRRSPGPSIPWSVYRWVTAGTYDLDYEATLATGTPIPFAVVATELPDRSLLIATASSGDSRLLRIPPDSDLRLETPRLVDGSLRADLLTQPGRNYVVRPRASLNGPAGEPVAELTGDGYLQEVQAEALGDAGFLELLRQ